MLSCIICRDKGAFHFNSKGAFGLRFCRKSKFNARGGYLFGYVCNVLSDSSIGKCASVLVFKIVNRQSVYASGGSSAVFFYFRHLIADGGVFWRINSKKRQIIPV